MLIGYNKKNTGPSSKLGLWQNNKKALPVFLNRVANLSSLGPVNCPSDGMAGCMPGLILKRINPHFNNMSGVELIKEWQYRLKR
jgi:hypothetical protein